MKFKITEKLYKKIIPVILVLIIFASCNNVPKQEKETTTPDSKLDETTSCYAYSKDSNYVNMKLTVNENKVIGSLDYSYYEKDKNKGTVKGTINNDTLLLMYDFVSEGVPSKRQVIFLKKNNGFTEGYGEMEEQSGEMVFKNKAAIKFDNKIILEKSECN